MVSGAAELLCGDGVVSTAPSAGLTCGDALVSTGASFLQAESKRDATNSGNAGVERMTHLGDTDAMNWEQVNTAASATNWVRRDNLLA